MLKNVSHVQDEALERYAMSTLPRRRTRPLEVHLLACSKCRNRLQAETDFVTAMRGAARQVREEARIENGVEVRVFKAGHSR
jgi:hypothetical protein